MSLDAAAQNLAGDAVSLPALRLAVHTGDPGAGAANELAGGGYARQPVAWSAAVGGIATSSGIVEFDVPAVTVTWVSLWNVAGTTRYGKALLNPAAEFPVAGKLRILAATIDWTGA